MRIDLSGRTFGRLTVIKKSDQKKHGKLLWECKCICGKICYVSYSCLNRGNVKSCGCLRAEGGTPPPAPRKDITGLKFGRLTALYPTEERSQQTVKWRCLCECGQLVTVKLSTLTYGDTKSCGCLNRELNLIKANTALKKARDDRCVENTNLMNIGQGLRSNNKSGTKGVCYNKSSKRWQAYIGLSKKSYYLGSYSDINDAIKARKAAEAKIHGEFLIWYQETYPDQAKKMNIEAKIKKIMDS